MKVLSFLLKSTPYLNVILSHFAKFGVFDRTVSFVWRFFLFTKHYLYQHTYSYSKPRTEQAKNVSIVSIVLSRNLDVRTNLKTQMK